MFRTRFLRIGSLAALVAGAQGCGDEAPAANTEAGEVDPVFGVVIDGLGANIADCNGGSATGTGDYDEAAKTLAMDLEGGSSVVSVVGNALTVNGWACYTSGGVALTTSNVKKLNLTSASGSADKVVFDLMSGSFGSIFSQSGGVTVDLQNAGDTFAVRGSAANNNMKIGESGGAVYVEASGDNRADIKVSGNVPADITFVLGAGNDTFRGDGGTNVSAAHIDSAVTVLDPLSSVDLIIYGGDGNDTLEGGDGDDTVYGGEGDDIMVAANDADGADTFYGGNGKDTVSYADRSSGVVVDINPAIAGTSGTVDLYALTFPIAGATVVSLDCDSTGAANADLDADASPADVVASMDGIGGCSVSLNSMNQIVVQGTTDAVIVDGAGGAAALLGLAEGTFDGDDADDGEAGEGDDVRDDVENLIGGSGADVLVGDRRSNVITGGAGADLISGGDGASGDCAVDDVDVLNGDDGADVFMMGPEENCADTVNGGAGVDRVDYQYRTEMLSLSVNNQADDGEADEQDNVRNDVEQVFGGSNDDVIVGGSAAEDLRGGAGDDTISGGGGNDTLVGHAGDDILNGDAGDDIFLSDGEDTDYITHSAADRQMGAGADIMNGGAGTLDKVDYEGRSAALGITLCVDSAALQGDSSLTGACADLDGEMDAPVLTGDADTSVTLVNHTGEITISFLGVDYPVNWAAAGATDVRDAINLALTGVGLVATIATDSMVLTPTLAPGDLSIEVTGADVADVFGAVTTTTAAPEGDSLVNAEWVIGSDAADIMYGADAAERLEGRAGDDLMSGGAGNDTLYGDNDVDTLNGDAGDDLVDGGAGADIIAGGDGDADLCAVDSGDSSVLSCEIE